jgi:uncharacterized protein YndB with AHSA1/START domain
MTPTDFVYVTYIRSTPEAVWNALTDPAFTRQFWFGGELRSDWKVGSPVDLCFPDGRHTDTGEVLEFDPPRRLSFSWKLLHAGFEDEGHSRVTFDLGVEGGVVKLALVHDRFEPGAKGLAAIGGGWPKILANLKSLLETGEALDMANRREPAKAEA